MAYRALTDVMLGHGLPALAGELIPETYLSTAGDTESVDFERLVELGAAEQVDPEPQKPPRRKAQAKD